MACFARCEQLASQHSPSISVHDGLPAFVIDHMVREISRFCQEVLPTGTLPFQGYDMQGKVGRGDRFDVTSSTDNKQIIWALWALITNSYTQ